MFVGHLFSSFLGVEVELVVGQVHDQDIAKLRVEEWLGVQQVHTKVTDIMCFEM